MVLTGLCVGTYFHYALIKGVVQTVSLQLPTLDSAELKYILKREVLIRLASSLLP